MISMREKQKTEAAVRLKLMGVREDVRQKFEKDGTVALCKGGQYYPVENWMITEIRRFELEHDASVFLVVQIFTVDGNLDALLFVDKYEQEWGMEREDIKGGYAMSYTINRYYDKCSEMGHILFRTTNDGGIVREG